MLEHCSSRETALLRKHICSKSLPSGAKQVLRYSCFRDPSGAVRAVIKCDPIFWAPCSWKDLRAPVLKVCYSAVRSVSIQRLAPERNLRCQIKHRSFLGCAGVSRWISRRLAGQGREACAARQGTSGERNGPESLLGAIGSETGWKTPLHPFELRHVGHS